MRKSERKIREPKEGELSFKIIYKSGVDSKDYWTIIHARNELDLQDLFDNKFYTTASTITSKEQIEWKK